MRYLGQLSVQSAGVEAALKSRVIRLLQLVRPLRVIYLRKLAKVFNQKDASGHAQPPGRAPGAFLSLRQSALCLLFLDRHIRGAGP